MGFGNTAKKVEVSVPVAETKEQKGTAPKKIKRGGVCVNRWSNKGEHSDFNTYTIERNYKQGNDWKSTTSLRAQDLPKAILALQQAYEESFESEQDEKD